MSAPYGADPYGSLIADAAGNLFGTTGAGGASGIGIVFEIAKTTYGYIPTPTLPLVSFNNADGADPYGSLTTDAAGNLFGTTVLGGASGAGTVFKITKTDTGYSTTPTTLVSFNTADGADPSGSLIADVAGNLFGTTVLGGANGNGTVFEITKTATGYSTTPTTLVSFNTTDGADPYGSLIADAAGNLFGTTGAGGASGAGTVFEITSSGFIVAPTISGTKVDQTTSAEAPVNPFSTVTIADTNSGATDTLTIIQTGNGMLTGTGLKGGIGGVYSLTGTAAVITGELDALSFTPAAGAPNTASTTTFVLNDKSSVFATPATNSATSVINTDPSVDAGSTGTNNIFGGQWGNSVIQGTAGADIITAYGWNNTIYDNGGNDVVNAGQGQATVYTGSGDVVVNLSGYNNAVTGRDGWNTVTGSQGNTTVSLGNGNDNIVVSGYNSVLQAGNGVDTVSGIQGNSIVHLGDGGDTVTAAGYSNQIATGAGNDTIVAGDGNDVVSSGAGNDTIMLGGWSNWIDAGAGNNTLAFKSGGGGNTVILHTAGTDQISGYTTTSGDVFDLRSVLSEAYLSIGSDFTKLGTYLHVSNVAGDASFQFDSTGEWKTGGGSTLAVLHGVGSSAGSLADLVFHNSLRIV